MPTPMDPVKAQYERFPYPPVSWLALPRRGEGAALAFEYGASRAFGTNRPGGDGRTHRGSVVGTQRSGRGIRILVAGAGTLEALVVAQANPWASEVIAVDTSAAAMRTLGRRAGLARWARPFQGRAKLRTVVADLREWEDGAFDFIVASNCLHHVADPAALLKRLASWLKPDGLIRVVTYPCASRIWMRAASAHLRARGLTAAPGAGARAFRLMAELPETHPARVAFESHPENGSDTGVIDAFLHACERPLRPLEWARACADAGLVLAAEDQTDTSRSMFLDELSPEARALDPWIKLQVLDDLLELCANPVLWLRRGSTATPLPTVPALGSTPSDARDELRENLRRVASFTPVAPLLASLREHVGPRVGPPPEEDPLPGLSILDHDPERLT